MTQEKRTTRTPSELCESPSPRGEGGKGPLPAGEEKEVAAATATAAAAAGRVRGGANSGARVQPPRFHARSSEPGVRSL